MDIRNPLTPTQNFYDRGASLKVLVQETVSQAFSSNSSGATYTVPANKKTYVEVINITLVRGSVATTEGLQQAGLNLHPSAGGIGVIKAIQQLIGNTTKSTAVITLPVGIWLAAGDFFFMNYQNTDLVAGSVDYTSCIIGTEFSA